MLTIVTDWDRSARLAFLWRQTQEQDDTWGYNSQYNPDSGPHLASIAYLDSFVQFQHPVKS